ncbi:MAG TPA: double-CXXCG motif protein, partial [Myxococcaceae bacterium]|nr:double-CXXCG motif protein [Myxococcaceae bacterium]
MKRFYWIREDKSSLHTGNMDAGHPWGLVGIHCPTCHSTWSSTGHQYPCVDLSTHPERAEFERPRPEPFDEFARLRELVRPLAPPGAPLPPGTEFGPLRGSASGSFGQLWWLNPWTMLVRREAMERLLAQGLRGIVGCPTELRFRQKNHPELLELQIEPHGLLHPDCLPPDRPPPCEKCGRYGFKRPEQPILDAASLPEHFDLFRL